MQSCAGGWSLEVEDWKNEQSHNNKDVSIGCCLL